MRSLHSTLTLTAALILASQANAKPSSTTAKSATRVEHSFNEAFKGINPTRREAFKDLYDTAPPALQDLAEKNFRTHKNPDYIQFSGSGHDADFRRVTESMRTLAPTTATNISNAAVTAIHTEEKAGYSMIFVLKNETNPKSLQIMPEHEMPSIYMGASNYEFPLGYGSQRKSGLLNPTDSTNVVPIRAVFETETSQKIDENLYTVMKTANGDRRITAHAAETIHIKPHWTKVDGNEKFVRASRMDFKARMTRENPNSLIDTAEITLDSQSLKYKLPNREDGVPHQIQDLKFKYDEKSEETFVTIITSENERITHKVVREGNEIKLEVDKAKSGLLSDLEKKEYIASKKALPGRKLAEPSGQGAKGLNEAQAPASSGHREVQIETGAAQ